MASEENELTVSGTAAVINDVAQECWQTSENSGFHEDWDMAAELEALSKEMREGAPTRIVSITPDRLDEIANILRTNIIGTKLMLTVSELAEALESLRDNTAAGVINGEGNVPEELADSHIRLHDLEGLIKATNIGDVMIAKMAVNKNRPFKHGRKL